MKSIFLAAKAGLVALFDFAIWHVFIFFHPVTVKENGPGT